jgi:hypothetical protein
MGGPFRINKYPDDVEERESALSTTAAVAVAAEVGDDNLFGVDSARVVFVKQSHLKDDPTCLVLLANLAVQLAVIVRVSYQVAIWTEDGPIHAVEVPPSAQVG